MDPGAAWFVKVADAPANPAAVSLVRYSALDRVLAIGPPDPAAPPDGRGVPQPGTAGLKAVATAWLW
jgi:hypothetical protein